MSFTKPDRYFSRITHVDIEKDILNKDFRYLFLDIDNTILPRDTHIVPKDVSLWLQAAKRNEIKICLVSNNWHHGVYDLAEKLDLPLVAKAVKPLPFAFLRARAKISANRKESLVIGDQLITDVLGAHFLGMKAYLLCPLVEQDLPHTLLLRNLERAFLGGLKPEPSPSALSSKACTRN